MLARWVYPIVCVPIAFVCSIISYYRIKERGFKGKWLRIAGYLILILPMIFLMEDLGVKTPIHGFHAKLRNYQLAGLFNQNAGHNDQSEQQMGSIEGEAYVSRIAEITAERNRVQNAFLAKMSTYYNGPVKKTIAQMAVVDKLAKTFLYDDSKVLLQYIQAHIDLLTLNKKRIQQMPTISNNEKNLGTILKDFMASDEALTMKIGGALALHSQLIKDAENDSPLFRSNILPRTQRLSSDLFKQANAHNKYIILLIGKRIPLEQWGFKMKQKGITTNRQTIRSALERLDKDADAELATIRRRLQRQLREKYERQTQTVTVNVRCPRCGGTGKKSQAEISPYLNRSSGIQRIDMRCSRCGGAGFITQTHQR